MPPTDATRRRLIKGLGAGAASAALGARLGPVFPATAAAAMSGTGASRIAPLPLADVRLLEGPFHDAQRRNGLYLLQLEPDRLLHNFRSNAGLAPKAPVYGGWESQQPWIDIRCHGHTLGHYLSACALQFAATGDARFRQRVDYLVDELAVCQQAGGDGLICAFPDGAAQLELSLRGLPFLGVPWYTLHKLCAGLRDAQACGGNAAALPVLVRLAEWVAAAVAPLSDPQLQQLLDREHGGMAEVLADVHSLTGEARYLALAQRFAHQALLTPLAAQQDVLDGLHSNTQIPKVIGYSRLHDLTGRADYRAAAEFFWRAVVQRRSFATGGNGDAEHFFPAGEFAAHLHSAKTMETCCTYNLLRLTRELFCREGSGVHADYYERALYNGILASQDPDTGMLTYFQATRPGYLKLYCTPFDSFWCCTGSGMESHAKHGDSIYFSAHEALYVNLFVASIAHDRQHDLTLTQQTDFPNASHTRLRIHADGPRPLRVMIRLPGWCAAPRVQVNGHAQRVLRAPDGYLELRRTWRDDDVIDVQLPMRLQAEALPGSADRVALLYGPIVLAGRLGSAGLAPGADLIVNERESGTMLDEPIAVPDWEGTAEQLLARVRRLPGKSLAFRVDGFPGSKSIELAPYHLIAHERYTLYWRVRPGTVAAAT